MALVGFSTFVNQNVIDSLTLLTEVQADNLDFGVTKLTDSGQIIFYNKYNYEEFADFKGADVKGKNYFTEIAPCTNNFLFSGRFKRGVAMNDLDNVFDYVFTYKMSPTKVKVHLHRDKFGGNWVFVKKV